MCSAVAQLVQGYCTVCATSLHSLCNASAQLLPLASCLLLLKVKHVNHLLLQAQSFSLMKKKGGFVVRIVVFYYFCNDNYSRR